MGLDVSIAVSHESLYHSYSNFHRFRKTIAKAVGINLEEMVGYDKENTKQWTGDEPFYFLFDHSDCDGEIYDVEDLLKDFETHRETVFSNITDEYVLMKYDEWIKLLKQANELGGYLHFG